jgi:hypothetical protein
MTCADAHRGFRFPRVLGADHSDTGDFSTLGTRKSPYVPVADSWRIMVTPYLPAGNGTTELYYIIYAKGTDGTGPYWSDRRTIRIQN